jgi:hypothetical protein
MSHFYLRSLWDTAQIRAGLTMTGGVW